MSACADIRYELGAYALGVLDDDDRRAVDAHLADCPECRAEVDSFTRLGAQLALVNEEQVHQAAEPPPELLDRTLAAVASGRRRGRRRLLLAAAAASVALGLGVGAGWSLLDQDGDSPALTAPPTTSASESSDGIAAQVGMEARGWGTALTVRMTGVPVKTRCRLVAVGDDGRRDTAASWEITYPGPARFEGATAIPRDRLQHLEIVTTQGHTLLTIPVA
ncbi:MAG: hypothetical protein GEV11_08420 [Streptosporangiales bacterium]|nr:hypothetical protein [Streptosporangiales bacterium]